MIAEGCTGACHRRYGRYYPTNQFIRKKIANGEPRSSASPCELSTGAARFAGNIGGDDGLSLLETLTKKITFMTITDY